LDGRWPPVTSTRDDFSDLAVGIPDEDFGGLENSGQIYVFDGSLNGLTFGRFLDYRDLSTLGRVPAAYDQFGYSLVWADFNGDTFGDLAIGVPNRDHDYQTCALGCTGVVTLTTEDAGAVVTIFGGPSSLTPLGAQEVAQGDPEHCSVWSCVVNRDPRFGGTMTYGGGDGFGLTLTAGDYDGDGRDDLGVGIPFKFVDDADAAGQVHVIFGSAGGLDPDRFLLLDQSNRDGVTEEDNRFGSALASGDFNDDGHDDLAVGVPREDSSAGTNTGIVQVFFGTTGAFSSFEQTFDQAAFPTLFDGRETGDLFGYSLAAGDFNGDGSKDLAIGVPGEDIGTTDNAGIVHVVYAGNGLIGCCTGPAPQVWHQGLTNMIGTAEAGDQFGFALSAWNFGRSSHADIAVGVPFEDVFNSQGATIVNAGAVAVIYGTANGLAATGNQQWTQNNLNGSPSEDGDQFGRSVY
jgi:hypothetical protein